MRVRRWVAAGAVTVGVAVASAVVAVSYAAAPPVTVTINTTTVKPSQRVTISLRGLPSASKRLRLYIGPPGQTFRSRLDPRLHYIGSVVSRAGTARLVISVPALPSRRYALWCDGCGRAVRAPVFALTMPAVTADRCPSSKPTRSAPPGLSGLYYGNDSLWTWTALDGRLAVPPDKVAADGSIGSKLYWWAARVRGTLSVSGKRLDAPSPALIVHRINEGRDPAFRGSATWAAPVTFPTSGCWRVVARVADVTLTQILSVGTSTPP